MVISVCNIQDLRTNFDAPELNFPQNSLFQKTRCSKYKVLLCRGVTCCFTDLNRGEEAELKSGRRADRKKMCAMFEAVVGLSRVQTCFSPSLIRRHGTV